MDAMAFIVGGWGVLASNACRGRKVQSRRVVTKATYTSGGRGGNGRNLNDRDELSSWNDEIYRELRARGAVSQDASPNEEVGAEGVVRQVLHALGSEDEMRPYEGAATLLRFASKSLTETYESIVRSTGFWSHLDPYTLFKIIESNSELHSLLGHKGFRVTTVSDTKVLAVVHGKSDYPTELEVTLNKYDGVWLIDALKAKNGQGQHIADEEHEEQKIVAKKIEPISVYRDRLGSGDPPHATIDLFIRALTNPDQPKPSTGSNFALKLFSEDYCKQIDRLIRMGKSTYNLVSFSVLLIAPHTDHSTVRARNEDVVVCCCACSSAVIAPTRSARL